MVHLSPPVFSRTHMYGLAGPLLAKHWSMETSGLSQQKVEEMPLCWVTRPWLLLYGDTVFFFLSKSDVQNEIRVTMSELVTLNLGLKDAGVHNPMWGSGLPWQLGINKTPTSDPGCQR